MDGTSNLYYNISHVSTLHVRMTAMVMENATKECAIVIQDGMARLVLKRCVQEIVQVMEIASMVFAFATKISKEKLVANMKYIVNKLVSP
jgi:hypothetical protein